MSYEKLVKQWLKLHSPKYPKIHRQYRSAVFYRNEDEKKICLGEIKKKREALKADIHSDVEPLTETQFYRAEEYHQDYLKKKGMVYS